MADFLILSPKIERNKRKCKTGFNCAGFWFRLDVFENVADSGQFWNQFYSRFGMT